MNLHLRTCIIATAGILLCVTSSSAMYTPNPAGRWDAQRFLLAGDFQFNGNKDLDNGGEIEDMAGFFVRPGYSVARNVILYARLGVQTSDHVDAGFAGGFGVQGTFEIPSAPEWGIGGAFDYLHWSGDISNTNEGINWNEFQITPAVSYAIQQFTPYAGFMVDIVDGRGSISQDDPVGLLFGTNWDPTPHIRLDTQVRVISETGFYISFGWIF